MDFCNNLKFYRKKKRMNQAELAEILGVGRTTITKWETGDNIPNIDILDMLASALDVSADDLLGRTPAIDKYKRTADTVRLLECYAKLNDMGKREAVKRVAELNMVPQYSAVDMPVAAHNDKKIDDDEMALMRQDIDEL